MRETKFLPKLHDIEACQSAYEMREHDYSLPRISEVIGIPVGTFSKWLRFPEKYSPFPDQVALDRARVEREVYDNLSNLELHMFWVDALKSAKADTVNGNVKKATKERLTEILGFGMDQVDWALEGAGRSPLYDGAGA